jgi:hypothetical protein
MLLSQLTLAYLEDQFVGFFLAIPDADALGSSLMVEEHGNMIGGQRVMYFDKLPVDSSESQMSDRN